MLIAEKLIKTVASSLGAEDLAELSMHGAQAGSPPAMPVSPHCRPTPTTGLAAELGVGRECVRQLGTSALQQLARAAAYDRYPRSRWRAVAARMTWRHSCRRDPRRTAVDGPDAVLADRTTPPDAGAAHPPSVRPASSALSTRAKAFKASFEPFTPPQRNARRDTGFPAATSLRATTRA